MDILSGGCPVNDEGNQGQVRVPWSGFDTSQELDLIGSVWETSGQTKEGGSRLRIQGKDVGVWVWVCGLCGCGEPLDALMREFI